MSDTAAAAEPAALTNTGESFDVGSIVAHTGATDHGITAVEWAEQWHGPNPRAHRPMPRTVHIASILLVAVLVIEAVEFLMLVARARQPDPDGASLGFATTREVVHLVVFGVLIGYLRKGREWARGCLVYAVSIAALLLTSTVVLASIKAFRGYSTVERVELVVEFLLILGVLRYLFHPDTRAYFSGRRQLPR